MNSSARRSRWSVVTPGATSAASSSRVRATSSPASRMRRSCSSVRPWSLLRRPNTVGCSAARVGREGLDETIGHLVELAHAVDAHEQADLVVVVAEGRGLAVVDRLALADDVLGVVGPTLGLG